MEPRINRILKIGIYTLLPTLIIWLPFFLRLKSFWGIPLPQDGMARIVANYDGPLFIVVAKTFYNVTAINSFPFNLPAIYYAAHFPLYPIFIRLFSYILGFPYAMLTVTVLSSFIALYFFNKFAREFTDAEKANWLTFVFTVLPVRWLIVRSVGSSEPLFIAAIIASLFYFRKEKYLLAGIWGAAATLTKSPGILLFVGYFFSIFSSVIHLSAVSRLSKQQTFRKVLSYLPILLIPLSLTGLFYFYKIQYNDFFAYFHSGDNIHLFFPPFQIFNYSQPWVGTFWLEDVIYVYLFGALGLVQLIKQKETALAWFVGIFFTMILFVSHRDVSRYALPIFPFILLAFSDFLTKREFKFVLAIIIVPLFIYGIVYISQNVMPIVDWSSLL